MNALIGVLFFLSLSAIYILSYYLNHKTKKPEGIVYDNEKCKTCPNSGCGNKV